MNLLIIEDEIILAQKYKLYLADLFDDIILCESYFEALQKTESNDFEVILADYHLPDGRGLEVIDHLKSDDCVFVMITAHSAKSLAIDSLNRGVFRFIEKPVNKEAFVKVLDEALQEAKRRGSLSTLEQHFMITSAAKLKLIDQYFITQRELEVIRYTLILGKNKNVGEKLSIGVGTVRNHLSHIFQKLHVNTRDELKKKILILNSESEK